MSPILFAIFVCVLIACVIHHAFSRPPKYPPGPVRLPVWGNLWQVLARNYKFPHKAMSTMAIENQDPVLGLFFGKFPVVVCNDYHSSRELLNKPEFQGRPDMTLFRLRSYGQLLGIFFTDQDFWLEQRRYSLREMRDFGFGRRFESLERAVLEEVQIIVDILKGDILPGEKDIARNGLAYVPDIFFAGFNNALLEVLIGQRFPRSEHATLRDLSRCSMLFQRSGEPSGGSLNITPWVRHFIPHLCGYTGVVKSTEGLQKFLEALAADQKSSVNEESPRGFVDMYLLEMKKREGKMSTFSQQQLIMIMMDYIFPTSSALGVTLGFALLYMIHFPEKTQLAFEEIEAVVGRNRLPTLDDRVTLPYTEAFLREVMRHSVLTPLGIPHRATENTYFRGYFVPKDAILLPNLWAAHRDPTVFENPNEFLPERFLDHRGNLKKKDMTLNFGLGKRLCAGETFARQNLFLFMSGLIQNFKFSAPDSEKIPNIHEVLPGIIITSEEFWVKVTERA